MAKKKFYITTAIPYVNAKPHIGHALEFVQVDTIARYQKLLGKDVSLLSGADENALKNVQAAEKAGIPVQDFVDKNAKLFQELALKLNIHFDIFQKGSDKKRHFPSSQLLWNLCLKNGDIDKKEYKGLYCVGCEAFYSPDELNKNGECFEHPGRKLEEVSEINYFFKLSKYQNQLLELVTNDELRIVPKFRKNEVLSFLKKPLLDISISRTNERAKNWGVPVPGDPAQRIYVWFDALNIYQSGIGFGWNDKMYKKWWPADVHVIGKGITRFHAIYWPAFLLSAKLSLPKTLFIHGYITVEGQKMSKTIGNVIDPLELIEKYGVDAVRYYLLKEIPSFDDGDFSHNRMKEIYNADLANELGNLIARVERLYDIHRVDFTPVEPRLPDSLKTAGFQIHIENFQFNLALEEVWKDIKQLNFEINKKEPWKKTKEDIKLDLLDWIRKIRHLAFALQPFLPQTAEKIIKNFPKKKISPLFPRL